MNGYYLGSLMISLAALGGACADNLLIKNSLKPVAAARVLGDTNVRPSIPFTGAPMELTLDGTGSSDPDGSIRVYRWASATPQQRTTLDEDAGADALLMHRRWVPDGSEADWPEDIAQPQVTLPAAGSYGFTLWVIDDQGLVSDPSTLIVELTTQ